MPQTPLSIALILMCVGASTFVLVSYLMFIWWLDRYEREPLWLVLLVFIWGALGGTCFSCIVNSSLQALIAALTDPKMSKIIGTVVGAPVVEEFFKGIVFVPLLLFGNHIDNRTDGLIYGAAVGLGFACLENLAYYIQFADQGVIQLIAVILMRTMFTALVHCTSSAMLGMAIGYARHRSKGLDVLLWPLFGYGCAVLNHAIWNGLATASSVFTAFQGAGILIGITMSLVVCAIMFLLTLLSLGEEHDVIKKYLLKEAELGTIDPAHAEIIPYWLKRRRDDWLPPHIDKEAYIKAATLLAFRHNQQAVAHGTKRDAYTQDIAAFRQQLRQMRRVG